MLSVDYSPPKRSTSKLPITDRRTLTTGHPPLAARHPEGRARSPLRAAIANRRVRIMRDDAPFGTLGCRPFVRLWALRRSGYVRGGQGTDCRASIGFMEGQGRAEFVKLSVECSPHPRRPGR